MIEEEIVLGLHSKNKTEKDLAFNKLYSKYYRLVVFVVRKYLKNDEDIEDLIQDIFLKLYQGKNNIKEPSTLSSYIAAMSKNAAINYAKKHHKYVQLENDEYIANEYNIIFIPEFSNFLKKIDANIIILKIYYGYKFNEISKLMDIPLETIASRYYRALEILKKHYGE